MKGRRKPAGIYRTLLRDAWQRTWERKPLWVFGLFAALVSTGGVVDVAARSLKRVGQGRDLYVEALSGTFPGAATFGDYLRVLAAVDAQRVVATVAALTLVGVALFSLAVLCQGALVAGASSKDPIPPGEALRRGGIAFFDLLAIALLSKAAVALAVLLSALPLGFFLVSGLPQDAAAFVLSFLVFFPLVVVIAVVAMLAAVHAVREREGLLAALAQGWRLFVAHPIACLELGLLLFGAVFAAGIVAFALIILLSIPYAAILTFALVSGVQALFLMTHVVGVLLLLTVLFTAAGGAIAFQYVAWTLFYERALRRNAVQRLASKLERLLA